MQIEEWDKLKAEIDLSVGEWFIEQYAPSFREELQTLIAKAERYEFLRSQPDNTDAPRIDVVHWVAADESVNEGQGLRGEQLDAAIDAAMKEQA